MSVGDINIINVSTKLDSSDFWGAVMVRWGINRNKYRVNPGLYSVGTPGNESDVFVTANYKLSFDTLRKNLSGIDGWILVLDTKGINVWCAAGKGTFGTSELTSRIKQVSLDKIVKHRRIILPQLSGTGVAAHKVKEETGFNVQYGPIRASDIKRFIENKYRADSQMRRVSFNLKDRIKLIPNDFMYGKFQLLLTISVFLLISGITSKGYSFKNIWANAGNTSLRIFVAYLSGIVFTPILLPLLPARFFSLKGFYTGVLIFLILFACNLTGNNIFTILSWFLVISVISSFTAMNFTGSSTFTSLSGVKKELKIFIPIQISIVVVGIVLQVIGQFN
jgi:hypothetical protein